MDNSKCAHSGKGNSTVTALGGSGELFQVVVDKLSSGGLHYTSACGGGVVGSALAEGDSLGHSRETRVSTVC